MRWLCKADIQNCNLATALTNASPWKISQPLTYSDAPVEYVIDHCLASSTTETCKLQYSLAIIIVVVCCNAIKLLAMLKTLTTIKEDQIITVGDGIASFLENPDSNTTNACLATKIDLKRTFSRPQYATAHIKAARSMEGRWNPDLSGEILWKQENQFRQRWFHAPSKKRWLICITL